MFSRLTRKELLIRRLDFKLNARHQEWQIYSRGFSHGNPNRQKVAVLGGGITGLSTAYYLSKLLPSSARIDLFEASSRLGGWLKSSKVDVQGEDVVFENGPRSLRPSTASGVVALDLIGELGLTDRIISTPKNSPAAQNRFIYYPDHLVRLPGPGAGILGNLRTLWQEPLFEGVLPALLAEVTKPQRPTSLQDESVGSFISRRFGPELADNIVSAVFHGIYAGNVYELSARTILPSLWHMEARHSSIIRSLLDQSFGGLVPRSPDEVELLRGAADSFPYAKAMPEPIKKCTVYTFRQGLGELPNRLEEALDRQFNTHIRRNTRISGITLNQNDSDKIQFTSSGSNGDAEELHDYDTLISTIPSSKLSACVNDAGLSSSLRVGKAVTVMVVNMFYTQRDLLPFEGFGYLLPRSLPLVENPEAALGVVFDTFATPQQDSLPGNKVTVMLGGHWWDGSNSFPDDFEGQLLAKKVLKRHLGIDKEPAAVRVSLQRDCIPQYLVGHHDRMSKISASLRSAYAGKLRVAGSSFTGVSVNDCIMAAKRVAEGLVHATDETGLDSFEAGRPWSWLSTQETKLI